MRNKTVKEARRIAKVLGDLKGLSVETVYYRHEVTGQIMMGPCRRRFLKELKKKL